MPLNTDPRKCPYSAADAILVIENVDAFVEIIQKCPNVVAQLALKIIFIRRNIK